MRLGECRVQLQCAFSNVACLFRIVIPIRLLYAKLIRSPQVVYEVKKCMRANVASLHPMAISGHIARSSGRPPFRVYILIMAFFIGRYLRRNVLRRVFHLLPIHYRFMHRARRFILCTGRLFFGVRFLRQLYQFPIPRIPIGNQATLQAKGTYPTLRRSECKVVWPQ